MSRLRKNIVANYLGRGWSMASIYLFVPLYVHYLGTESYGVVAFYAVMFSVFSVANVGLSATLSRELARLTAKADASYQDEANDVARTLELIFVAIAAAVAAVSIGMSSIIATEWVNAEELPVSEIAHAVQLMGIAMALRFPIDFYHGGIMGLQHQATSNLIQAAFATLRGGLAVLFLAWVSSTIACYFWTQIIANIVELAVVRWVLWRNLPKAQYRPQFSLRVLKSVGRYAAGMCGISVISIVLSQVDKLAVSKMLSLEAFACYGVVGILARAPISLGTPVGDAVFPRLSQLVGCSEDAQIRAQYHRACQLVACMTLPISVVLAFFSKTVLNLWTNDSVLADQGHFAAALLLIGSVFISLLIVPYRLALAHGWTSLNLVVGVISVVLIVPLTVVLTKSLGLEGAAIGWLVLNGAILVPYIVVLHRKVLPGATPRWLWADVGLPLGSCLIAVASIALFIPIGNFATLGKFVYLGLAWLAATAAVLASIADLRKSAFSIVKTSYARVSKAS